MLFPPENEFGRAWQNRSFPIAPEMLALESGASMFRFLRASLYTDLNMGRASGKRASSASEAKQRFFIFS
jgi:hypothetical protein